MKKIGSDKELNRKSSIGVQLGEISKKSHSILKLKTKKERST